MNRKIKRRKSGENNENNKTDETVMTIAKISAPSNQFPQLSVNEVAGSKHSDK